MNACTIKHYNSQLGSVLSYVQNVPCYSIGKANTRPRFRKILYLLLSSLWMTFLFFWCNFLNITGNQSGLTKNCEICLKRKSAWKCVDCRTWLCDECKEHHHRLPTCRGHKIEDIKDETDVLIKRPVFCDKHLEQLVIINCQDCETPLCCLCIGVNYL